MAQVELKGLHLNVKGAMRGGVQNFYHYTRRGGGRFAVTAERVSPNLSAELYSAYLAVMADVKAKASPAVRAAKAAATGDMGETLGELAAAWMVSPEWRKFTDNTRKRLSRDVAKILATVPHGHAGETFATMPLAAVELPQSRALFMRMRADVAQGWKLVKLTDAQRRGLKPTPTPPPSPELGALWLDSTAKRKPVAKQWSERPASADDLLRAAQALLSWGLKNGRIMATPLATISHLYESNRADIIWTPDDLAQIKPHATPALYRAMMVAGLTGLGPVDLAALTWGEVDANDIELGRGRVARGQGGRRKTNESVVIPMYPALAAALGDCRSAFFEHHGRQPTAADPVCITSRGKAWTEDNINHQFTPTRAAAGMDATGLRFYDLRGTAATNLRTVLEAAEVAAILGWSELRVEGIIKRYVDRAKLTRKIADRIAAGPRLAAVS